MRNAVKRVFFYKGLLLFFMILCSCKQKQAVTDKPVDTSVSKIKGRVSHRYKLTGCETIIICNPDIKNDTLFLIPMNSLEKFDSDGLKISFNYRILRVHNPKGCKQGIPAEIFNIKKD